MVLSLCVIMLLVINAEDKMRSLRVAHIWCVTQYLILTFYYAAQQFLLRLLFYIQCINILHNVFPANKTVYELIILQTTVQVTVNICMQAASMIA